MTLRLHDYLPSGNGYKVRLLLTQLGIPFERIEYDIDRGETRTPEFLQNVNANGRVPVLETEEGEFLPESNAILFYLSCGTPLLPEDRLGRARALQWMFSSKNSQKSQNACT
jgi:glutathione S-transferase